MSFCLTCRLLGYLFLTFSFALQLLDFTQQSVGPTRITREAAKPRANLASLEASKRARDLPGQQKNSKCEKSIFSTIISITMGGISQLRTD